MWLVTYMHMIDCHVWLFIQLSQLLPCESCLLQWMMIDDATVVRNVYISTLK